MTTPPATLADSHRRFDLLGVHISAVTFDAAVAMIGEWGRKGIRTYVNACPVDVIVRCHDSPELTRIVNCSGLVMADGMPVVWIGRLLGWNVERGYGPDLMLEVCRLYRRAGDTPGFRHFLYGGTSDILEKLETNLERRFPGIEIVGRYAPPFRPLTKDEDEGVVRLINEAHATVVWCGLGTPKQIYWMAEHREFLTTPVLIGVGAAFNFHAGVVRQAPRWMMRVGLEWLFRLAVEPRRLWKRYLVGNTRFVLLVLGQWIRGRLLRKSL